MYLFLFERSSSIVKIYTILFNQESKASRMIPKIRKLVESVRSYGQLGMSQFSRFSRRMPLNEYNSRKLWSIFEIFEYFESYLIHNQYERFYGQKTTRNWKFLVYFAVRRVPAVRTRTKWIRTSVPMPRPVPNGCSVY